MRIQHNIMAMNAYRNYNTNTSALSKNLEKLSSGYKINRAGDDAAGLAISEKMRAQITGLNAAQKNVKDGISLVKTAEGAMQEIQDMLNRMDYLATQSANGTYQDEVDRENLNKEVTALKTEINRIADSANFNGIKLLDGSLAADGKEGVKEPGDYIMLDAGSNEISLLKNQQIAAATQGKYTLQDLTTTLGSVTTTANENGFSFDVRYIDEAGAEQTKTITVAPGAAYADENAIAAKISSEIVNAKIGFSAGTEANATKADTFSLDSTTKGSTGAQLLGITIKSYGTKTDGTGTVTVNDPVEVGLDKAKTIQGKDRDVSNKLSFANAFKEGDVVTIGDKTYELVDPAAINKVKDGNIAVAIGLNADGTIEQEGTIENLTNALIANGVSARHDTSDATNQTILIDDLADISIKRDSIDVKVNSGDITTGNAKATSGVWQFTAGVGSAKQTNLTIKYIDADGKEQSRVLQYTGTADAKTNAAAIVAAINADEVLNKMFKAEQTVNGKVDTTDGTDVRLTALEAGANAPKALSAVSNDAANTVMGGTFTTVSEGKDAAAGFVLGDNIKAGDTVSVAGKTFEFVKEGDVGKVSNGNFAVVIGTDGKKTAANFNEALKDAGFTTSYLKDTNAVRVVENEFSLGSANKTGSGGLTLQIGDTADTFNQMTVNIGDMHVSAMGTGKTTLDGKSVNVTKTIADIDIGSLEGAQEAIAVVKNAINYVSGIRGDLGAVQNRLEHTQNNLSVMAENIQDAESNIRDTDVAEEMMAYTKNNILVQSAQAMLAQANQVPQGVLQLLG